MAGISVRAKGEDGVTVRGAYVLGGIGIKDLILIGHSAVSVPPTRLQDALLINNPDVAWILRTALGENRGPQTVVYKGFDLSSSATAVYGAPVIRCAGGIFGNVAFHLE